MAARFMASPAATLRSPVSLRAPRPARVLSSRSSSAHRANQVSSRPARFVTSMASFYDFSPKLIGTGSVKAPVDGVAQPLSAYEGKVVMVQNVATL
mmetsp:Transcript_27816/g.52930  ORF Transcript_27816/g.52930 Transcript_27816/m.52930 type:complete len:96 (+) Transcript_27816:35-322(+)